MESGRSTLPAFGPGTVLLDKWRLDSLLARGTTSEVFAATHRNSRRFAIKILSPALVADPTVRTLLVEHAYLANQIPHEGVIHTLDDDVTAEGIAFTAMDLVDGETLLARWQREGRRLRPSHALEIALSVLEVLSAAHQKQITHGALGFDHVLLARGGRVKLCGFGSARHPKLVESANTVAVDVGTSIFVAPEQALGSETGTTPRSDIYAVGAMTFALLTGAFALDGATRSFGAAIPTLAEPLARALDRALAFDPAARFPSAAAMREALSDATSEAVRVKTGPRPALAQHEQTLVSVQPNAPRVRGVTAQGSSSAASTPPSEPGATSGTPGAPSASPLSGSTGARRGTATMLVAAGLDEASAKGLRGRAQAHGFRVEEAGTTSVLVFPAALANVREEALEMGGFALELAELVSDAAISLVTGVDLLTEHTATHGALRAALARAPSDASPIRLDAATARLLEASFEVAYDPTGPVLVGEKASDGGFRRLLGAPSAFVGRDADVAEVTASFSRAVGQSTAHALLVVAEAGFGKSRLVEEAVDRIRTRHSEVEVWSVNADPMRREVAFGVAARIIARASGAPRDDTPDGRRRAITARVASELAPGAAGDVARISGFLAEISGVGFTDDSPAQVQRARRDATSMGDQMRFAFLDFMSAIVSRRPLAIVVEDLQWIDAASLELLGHALSLLKPKPWMILATARPEIDAVYPLLWPATRKRLGALERVALETIARGASSSRPLDDAEVARSVALARGNPLHLEEVLRMRAEGVTDLEEGGLSDVVAKRVAALDPVTREVLSKASVFGSSFSSSGVAALSLAGAEGSGTSLSSAQLSAALDELCRRELVVASPRRRGASEYVFRHALVREVAYALLVQRERVVAHRSAGVFLERQGERESAVLAEHFARANAEAEAAAWYERSAAEALARSDVSRALELAERGLAYRPREDVALSLWATKAECHVWKLQYVEARAAASEVVSRTPRGSLLWSRSLPALATGLTRGGDPEGATRLAEGILASPVIPADKPAFAAALTALVTFSLRQGRHDLVRGLMDLGAELAGEPGADPATIAHTASARSWCAMFAGDFSECLRHDREVVRRFEEAGDLRNGCRETASVGYDLTMLGAYEEAELAFRSALAVAERLGIARVVAGAKHHLSLVTLRLGRLEEAHRLALEALDLGRGSADSFALASMRLYLGLVLAAQGDDLGAAKALLDSIESFAPTPAARAWPLSELARVRLSEGRIEEAIAAAEAAMAVVAASGPAEEGDAVIRLTHAEVLLASGRTADAQRAAGRARSRLDERAERISDATLRQSFLYRIPEHARTIELSHRLSSSA